MKSPISVPSSFWRGGTSRGLLFRAKDMAKFTQVERDNILLESMGSPDPDGRQISGLGGGVSSLSKACIVGTPGEGLDDLVDPWKGVPWADQGSKDGLDWDVVYRFGQVAVRNKHVDWTSTCGNMVSAVASHAISHKLIPESKLDFYLSKHTDTTRPYPLPIKILAANIGKVIVTKVLIDSTTKDLFYAQNQDVSIDQIKIAGVPELGARIETQLPIEGSGSLLPTGSPTNTLNVDGVNLTVSIIDAGLPNIFLDPSQIPLLESAYPDSGALSLTPDVLDSVPGLHQFLEKVRKAGSELNPVLATVFSDTAPKICLVGLPKSYKTTGGDQIEAHKMADIAIRSVSVGNFHKTVPGTTLAALNVAKAIPSTLISNLVHRDNDGDNHGDLLVSIKVAQPAGITKSRVSLKNGIPQAIVMDRTSREIMRGNVFVSP